MAAKNGVFIKTYMDYKIIDISRNKLKVRISFVKITVRSEVKTLVLNIFHCKGKNFWQNIVSLIQPILIKNNNSCSGGMGCINNIKHWNTIAQIQSRDRMGLGGITFKWLDFS